MTGAKTGVIGIGRGLPKITTVILSKDEEAHIARAINSVKSFSTYCIVVDSGSTDKTIDVAEALGAKVYKNPWTNYSTQFNWALTKVPKDSEWVLRLDADEYVTEELSRQIALRLPGVSSEIHAVFVARRMHFMGKRIEWGGVFPVMVARLFRNGKGRCEERWMDEHIVFDGPSLDLSGELVDDNLNSITWWTSKHNNYASREVVDILNAEYKFLPQETVASLSKGRQAEVKRWVKENLYTKIPSGGRAFLYFIYRFFFRLGFLDGKEGRAFHVLQGFWYRYLVDTKLSEVRKYMKVNDADPVTAIGRVLGINLESV